MTYPPRRRWSFFDIDFSHREWSFLPTMLSRCWFVRNPNHYFRSSLCFIRLLAASLCSISTFSLLHSPSHCFSLLHFDVLAASFAFSLLFFASFSFSMHSFAGSSLRSSSSRCESSFRPSITAFYWSFGWFVCSLVRPNGLSDDLSLHLASFRCCDHLLCFFWWFDHAFCRYSIA